jgi:ring-1,2-phenylacetyl-CoA epoxidase subunit PaaD
MSAALQMQQNGTPRPAVEGRVYDVLAGVPDPEIPVVSVVDLGIIRRVEFGDDGAVRIGVSPTYSGCPATAVIKHDIVQALRQAGFGGATAFDVLSPPWTSDWISDEGRRKLSEYGIAPPTPYGASGAARARSLAASDRELTCPRCGSPATERLSEFGSTPCKALYRCTSCLEPFDHFKCI